MPLLPPGEVDSGVSAGEAGAPERPKCGSLLSGEQSLR